MEATPRMRRWTRTLAVAAVLVAGGTGCDGHAEVNGAAVDDAPEAKCAYLVQYEGRSYLDVRGGATTDPKFTVGKSLGTGLLPGCDESDEADGTQKPEKVSVYEVEGIDAAVAVAAGNSPEEAVLVAVRNADLTSLNEASREGS
ncbi:DUF6281 family protein [Streptomyces sp. NPDC059785]|uniref:DUF6281 family protein n=1 Tax=unclassified Streptomyces TaxID=2593676 RepID=UPI0036473321